MLKRTITYEDYNGNTRTEEFLFNLTKAEATEMELTAEGGLSAMLTRVVNANDMPTVVKFFKKFVLQCYGEKSPDGRRFVKSDEISTAFSQTEAYSILFMELSTNADKAAEFVNAVVPKVDAPAKPEAPSTIIQTIQ